MKSVAPKAQRCAIYTRKSTEHNLDLAFNSLDAQREACEAYIKSQAHEGWRLIADRFDDGGISGASLDREALQTLLERVRARKIDVIVVYKVDRLTRSLADFAKLVELFDEFEVSFVSITQSFNTTSSMGRLTLNVLLSFAQFEREVIGERVRDKIAASKRRGIWVGGPVPFGYRSVDKKIEVVEDKAELVRKIFADYLRLGSIVELAASLDREGLKPNPRRLVNGKLVGAERFTIGPLAYLLKNRFYVGEIAYRGEVYKGEHEAIVQPEVFGAAQAQLTQRTVKRKLAGYGSASAILTGRLFDDRGHPMSPSHANKKGVRYRYYVSQAVLKGRKSEAGSVVRVSAPDIERSVCDEMRRALDVGSEIPDRDIVRASLEHAVLQPNAVAVAFRRTDGDEDSREELIVPFATNLTPRKGVSHTPPDRPATIGVASRNALLKAIARSRGWIDWILTGKMTSTAEIATAEGVAERHIRFLAPLAFVSPKVVAAIADREVPAELTASELARKLPHRWDKQERMLRVG
jgi:site-specific DNA recombinase